MVKPWGTLIQLHRLGLEHNGNTAPFMSAQERRIPEDSRDLVTIRTDYPAFFVVKPMPDMWSDRYSLHACPRDLCLCSTAFDERPRA